MRLTPNQQDALDIKKHVCVTAGAGSGKTTVLVKRYLKILSEGNVKSPREIVAITFTEKAAAEMKERIIEELSAQETRDGIERSESASTVSVKRWGRRTFQPFTLFAHVS